jgi:hypothetical protein
MRQGKCLQLCSVLSLMPWSRDAKEGHSPRPQRMQKDSETKVALIKNLSNFSWVSIGILAMISSPKGAISSSDPDEAFLGALFFFFFFAVFSAILSPSEIPYFLNISSSLLTFSFAGASDCCGFAMAALGSVSTKTASFITKERKGKGIKK